MERRLPQAPSVKAGYQHHLGAQGLSLAGAARKLKPLEDTLARYNTSGAGLTVTLQHATHPSYWAYYDTYSGTPAPAGSLAALGSPHLQDTLHAVAGSAGELTTKNPCFVGGGAVAAPGPATARRTYLHHIVARPIPTQMRGNETVALRRARDVTDGKAAALKALAPRTGSYMNEGDRLDGARDYGVLGGVKRRYDGAGLFYCETCVGSEGWAEDGEGALCRV